MTGKKRKQNVGDEAETQKATKRPLKAFEERFLVEAFKRVCDEWRSENGFRPNYHNAIETVFLELNPGSDIKANPHISSKVRTWKREYYKLVDFLSRSGTGFNDLTNTLDASDKVWTELEQHMPTLAALRGKVWPFFRDWQVIYGKDKASGEGAMGYAEAVNQNTPNQEDDNIGIEAASMLLEYPAGPTDFGGFGGDGTQNSYAESSHYEAGYSPGSEMPTYTASPGNRSEPAQRSGSATQKGKYARKTKESEEPIPYMDSFMEMNARTCSELRSLGQKLGELEREKEEKQILVNEIIRTMTLDIEPEDRFAIADAIGSNQVRLNYFIASNEHERQRIVRRVANDLTK